MSDQSDELYLKGQANAASSRYNSRVARGIAKAQNKGAVGDGGSYSKPKAVENYYSHADFHTNYKPARQQ